MSHMKLRKWFAAGFSICALALMGFLGTGCLTSQVYSDPAGADAPPSDQLRVGETVRVVFSNVGPTPIQYHEEQIKHDGSITLFLVGSVQAAGKTSGEVQKDLQQLYSKYYREMTVTVTTPDRSYSVGGQVRVPDRKPYVGPTTVLKAIQSVGDFTDFANRKKVQLTRVDGRTYIVNCEKALRNPKLDLPVYPGDSIHVPRSVF